MRTDVCGTMQSWSACAVRALLEARCQSVASCLHSCSPPGGLLHAIVVELVAVKWLMAAAGAEAGAHPRARVGQRGQNHHPQEAIG
jgi:hypothetical protein